MPMLIDRSVSHATFQCVRDLEGLWKAMEDIDTDLGTELGNETDNSWSGTRLSMASTAVGGLWPRVCGDHNYGKSNLAYWKALLCQAQYSCAVMQGHSHCKQALHGTPGKCTGHANQTMWHCQMVQCVLWLSQEAQLHVLPVCPCITSLPNSVLWVQVCWWTIAWKCEELRQEEALKEKNWSDSLCTIGGNRVKPKTLSGHSTYLTALLDNQLHHTFNNYQAELNAVLPSCIVQWEDTVLHLCRLDLSQQAFRCQVPQSQVPMRASAAPSAFGKHVPSQQMSVYTYVPPQYPYFAFAPGIPRIEAVIFTILCPKHLVSAFSCTRDCVCMKRQILDAWDFPC